MSNILKVSVPTSGIENTAKHNPITSNDVNIQNVVDPSKVMKGDGQKSNPDKNLGANYESNFQKFISELKNKPEVVEVFSQILFRMESVVSSGINEDFAKEIAKFLEMLKMTPEEAVEFLKLQGSQSSKFSSEIFKVLRGVMENTKSVELKTAILNFLKSYNNVSSSGSTLKSIVSILKNMSKYMPQSYKQSILNAAESLKQGRDIGATNKNIDFLKREVIPFLSNYTQRTHDMGRVRDFITLLTLNTARYESSTMDKLIFDFQKMCYFEDFRKAFGSNSQKVLEDFLSELRGIKSDNFADALVSNMQRALSGEAGYEMKSVFQNIMNSMLINESVYMPLAHFIFPAEMFGNMLFSEMWVDPNGGSGNSEDEKIRKILIKFDIKDVGFFDLIIFNQGSSVELSLRCPEKFMSIEKEIKKGVSDLVEQNGFNCKNFYLSKADKPIAVSDVFPQIYERKNGVNVKI